MIKNMNLILATDESMILENGNELSLSLAMGIISSYLNKKGIGVTINDTNKEAGNHNFTEQELSAVRLIYDKDRVLKYIETGKDGILDKVVEMFLGESWKGYDSYGISVGADFSLLQIHLGFIFAAYLKKKTACPIFIGGNNISYLYIFEDFYKELLMTSVKSFPFIMKGPGEQVIWEIIDGINKGQAAESFENMDGILRIKDGTVLSNKERAPIVISPNWDSLNMNDYSYPIFSRSKENEEVYYRFPLALSTLAVTFNKPKLKARKLIIPYIFNYNCAFNCAFCTQSDTDRSALIIGDVKKVADDLEFLSQKYNTDYFYFLNNYFPLSIKYIKAFRDELEKRNLHIFWSDCGRVNGLTLEKLQILHKTGCRKLVFGFETGSEKILNLIDKRLSIDELVKVLGWCREVGIWADLEVIIGLPYEREAEFMETYNFIKEHKTLINNFWLNEYFVVPNSLIGRYPEKYGIELVKNGTSYSELMKKNQKGFDERNLINLTSNARLWGFNEINNEDLRSYDDMKIQNADKIHRLSGLINSEFNQLYDFYSKLIKFRKKR